MDPKIKTNIILKTETKICTKCKRELPATLEYFSRAKGVKSGIRSQCKECSNRKERERYRKKAHDSWCEKNPNSMRNKKTKEEEEIKKQRTKMNFKTKKIEAMKYTKQCPYCNEEFETDMSYKKFCCEEHQHIYNFGIIKKFKGKNLKCKECGENFTQNRPNQKFCKNECYKDYHYREQHGKDRPKIQINVCKECGENFTQNRANQIFCGQRCHSRFKNKQKKLLEKARRSMETKKQTVQEVKNKSILDNQTKKNNLGDIKKFDAAIQRIINIVEGIDKMEEYKEFIEKRNLEINQFKKNNTNDFSKKIGDKNEKIEKLNKTIKDLLSDPNDRLLKTSKLKITGFPPKEFYNKFIHTTNGDKPEIKWNGNITLDKLEYQKILKQLENQRNLDNLFYLSKEWLKRSNEISARDKEKCIYCGRKCHTVHHKKSALYNPTLCLDPNNLITVCKRCESELHFRNRGEY